MFHVFPCVAVCLSLYVRDTVAQTFVSLVSYNYVYLCVSEIMLFKLDSLLFVGNTVVQISLYCICISVVRIYCSPNLCFFCCLSLCCIMSRVLVFSITPVDMYVVHLYLILFCQQLSGCVIYMLIRYILFIANLKLVNCPALFYL
jgi:hypothetical protein